MKSEGNSRQLKLSERSQDEVVVEKKKGKKRNKARDRWVVFMVLLITVLVSLGFYVASSGFGGGSEKIKTEKEEKVKKGDGFFAPAVYEF